MASRPNVGRDGPAPLTDDDREYARMLLDWSHSLDHSRVRFEDYRLVWLYEREGIQGLIQGLTSPDRGSASGSA